MMRTTTTLLLAIVLLAGCKQYEKTPSGLTYKISKGSGKEKLKHGQMVSANIEYRISPKDTLLLSTYGHIPMYFTVDTSRKEKHTFTEFLNEMAAGDKAEFVMNVDTMKKLNMLDYNEIFHQHDLIKGKIEILKTFASQEEMKADYDKQILAENENEKVAVKKYAEKKGYKTQTTRSGVLVEIQNPGTGAKADSGMMVAVMYKGFFELPNGKEKEFDSNNQPASTHKEPYRFVIGTNAVIPGWDEGLRLFSKGGKGRLIVPAFLAYGPNGSAPAIPPHTNLVFDVELVDVSVPPPPPPVSAQPVPAPVKH
ncbi:FKBP-type peptidyl-prolyl cis-trans isomerase [Sediminibacterium ginsengisoli]|uniref:Peptidyl-prolyl cis-trans isomerase n=1 Tax=Sediminibacterium ginsengisoli TaxID=413434 RepID=A0A1T4RBW3_9BACT|nr:FKBP-type peptidyl-prolyl cis-trans isomerase [Sediminibacterium ginsengisoli]SKA13306.1 FKBP-type peptidyl-prolyl cis-trans isomerase [Sediminibacterium ginsengisoli]